jgi:hypothetical protein
VAEFVPGYEASTRSTVGAPKATPADIVDKLNNSINAGLADAKMKAAFRRPWSHRSAGLACRLRQVHRVETGKWAKVIKFAHQAGVIGAALINRSAPSAAKNSRDLLADAKRRRMDWTNPPHRRIILPAAIFGATGQRSRFATPRGYRR